MKVFIPIFLVLAVLISGCAHVVSRDIRDKAAAELTFAEILRNPDAYRERTVILGGVIVSSINKEEGTYIEVVQKPLDYWGRPLDTDISHGRFIILYEGYLDTAIYSRGREVTVAGEVAGKMARQLGEIQYPYPLIKSREIHLFEYRIPIRIGIGIWKTF
jgi:outer membrane lipoprotein